MQEKANKKNKKNARKTHLHTHINPHIPDLKNTKCETIIINKDQGR